MKRPHAKPDQAQRTETFTVNVGTFYKTTVDITFEISATVWSGARGVGGAVSAHPVEVLVSDREGCRAVNLRAEAR